MICNECETVAHCTKHGCVPKQPAPVQPVALEQEREAFEAWHDSFFVNKGHAAHHRFHDRDGYCIDEIQNQWKGWKERAKRTTPAAAPVQDASKQFHEWAVAEHAAQPSQLPTDMPRDEMLQYYSDYANLCAIEALRYQKRIHELETAAPAAPAAPVPLTDDPLQGAVDWFLQADGEYFCTATVQRTLRIGYNRAKRLCDTAKERAAHGITKGGAA